MTISAPYKKEYRRQYHQANREHTLVVNKRWRDNNRVKLRATNKAWREANKDKLKTYKREWARTNWNMIRINTTRRRALKDNASGSFSVEHVIALLEKQGNTCAAPSCNHDLSVSFTIDHKTPLSRGGSNWPRNLQLLCSFHNTSKGTKTQREWHRSLGVVRG